MNRKREFYEISHEDEDNIEKRSKAHLIIMTSE